MAVDDPQIPENTGCFEVAFAPGQGNRVRRVDDAPDIALTIRDFGRLIVGCCEPDPMWLPDVRLNAPIEAVAKVFFRKPTFISTYF